MNLPNSNYDLGATNRVIKDEDTIRERFPSSRFTVILFEVVGKWSKERNPTRLNAKKFEHEPTITLAYWTEGYNWVKLNKEVISISKSDETIYYIPAGEETTIIEKEVKRYENCRFNLFDTYKYVYFKIWCLCLSNNPEEWRASACTCPFFLKNYICKHVIGMSIRLKYCKPPPEAKNLEGGTKEKEEDHLKLEKLNYYNSASIAHSLFIIVKCRNKNCRLSFSYY